ncbi:exodeoxyribonuclease III [Ilumatobacter sp.]|uniref:exodeoxyribonuclease III n=1 Tax=Ilumatobacter sp. TaxID=1967498 RepID=UPI003B522A9F
MRIVTWNVNSLRARQERVEEWLDDVEPDVVLLQETKLADDAFGALAFESRGYASAHHGQGQWNGVAILSRVGLDDVVAGFAGDGDPDPDARLATATCGGVRVSSVYVPNGRSLDDDHYTYKLWWLGRLLEHLDVDTSSDGQVVVGGDFNIAPDDRDVWDPDVLVGATHGSPAERDRLAELESWGLIDVFREFHDADRVFSWWDYRRGDFHQGRGMRIDLLMCSASVVERARWSAIDRNARKGKQPSDHAPVLVDLAD